MISIIGFLLKYYCKFVSTKIKDQLTIGQLHDRPRSSLVMRSEQRLIGGVRAEGEAEVRVRGGGRVDLQAGRRLGNGAEAHHHLF